MIPECQCKNDDKEECNGKCKLASVNDGIMLPCKREVKK